MDRGNDRTLITGVGVLACNGIGREAFWDALVNGKSGIGIINRFDPEEFPCKIAGQLWDFNPDDWLKKADVKRWHRPVHQALAAAEMAVKDAELETAGYAPERIAVGIGTSVGSLDESYEDYKQ
ncbi:MAG: beta-ketoacyl synthase N-terminal-like domain-containing protein, partial [Candidatus Hydrogenedentota bacterium]